MLVAKDFDFSKMVKRAVDKTNQMSELHGSEISTVIESGIHLYGDQTSLEQVVRNIIGNAIKYGEGNPVSISIRLKRGSIILKVRDRGMGIAKENLDRIFQRFGQAGQGNALGGLGLGLYISKKAVETHRGKIYVTSELNKGSCFTVVLPSSELSRLRQEKRELHDLGSHTS